MLTCRDISADAEYEAGTVVKLGGSEEITQTKTRRHRCIWNIQPTHI